MLELDENCHLEKIDMNCGSWNVTPTGIVDRKVGPGGKGIIYDSKDSIPSVVGNYQHIKK